jgi:hypothetical protein
MSSTKKTLMTPKGFTGDQNLAQLWLYKVDTYFKVNATNYGDDVSKIYFILRLSATYHHDARQGHSLE